MSEYNDYNTNFRDSETIGGIDYNVNTFMFTSFSGTELQAFIRIDGETIKLGELEGIGGVIKTQYKPLLVIGSSEPIALAKGERIIQGSLKFSVFYESALKIIQNGLKTKASTNYETIKALVSVDQLPPFDIIIVAIKEDNPGVKAKKVIRGVEIFSESSSMGTDVIAISEDYSFSARTIEPLKREGE